MIHTSKKETSVRAGRGFTVIELMFTLALVSILAGLAAPDFRQMVAESRMRSVSNDLFSDMKFARSEAIATNKPVEMAGAVRGDFSSGWTVQDYNGNIPNVKRRREASNVATIATVGGIRSITFNTDGRLDAPDIAGGRTFLIVPTDGTNVRMRCVRIGFQGKTTLKVDSDTNMNNGC